MDSLNLKGKGKSMSSLIYNGLSWMCLFLGFLIIIVCNVISYVIWRSNDVKGKLKLIVFCYFVVMKDSDVLDLGFWDILSGLID